MISPMVFRFFAWLLDVLIILTGEFAMIFAVSVLDHNMMQWFGMSYEQKLAVINVLRWPMGVLFLVWPWLYTSSLEASDKQATYGKFLFDMVVTDKNGKRITFLRSTARFWAKFLSTALLFLGYVPAFFNRNKLTLHDLICGTQVRMVGKDITGEGL